MTTNFLFANQSIVSGVLLLGDVLATIAVAYGIVLETPENPDARQRRAVRFVIIGVVFETFFSIGLFAFDQAVMSAQGTDIETLSHVTEDAEKAAAKAKSEANIALATAGTAKTGADSATTNAASAQRDAGEAETRVAAVQNQIGDLTAAENNLRASQKQDRAAINQVKGDAEKAETALQTAEKADEANIGRVAQVAIVAIKRTDRRTMDLQRCPQWLQGITPVPIDILYSKLAPDGMWLASDISECMKLAGWPEATITPTPPNKDSRIADWSDSRAVGGGDWGVSFIPNRRGYCCQAHSAEEAIYKMLEQSLGETPGMGGWPTLPLGHMRIVIAPKP